MGDASEKFEMNEEDGPVDSQEPLTFQNEKDGYGKERVGKDRKKDIRSFCLSVFNLMNAILGSGILGLAEAMKNLGVLLFYVLLIMTACLAGYTINLLLIASKAAKETTYEGLAVKSFGFAGKVATSLMIVIHCLGAMCSYVFIIKAEMPEVVKVFFDDANSTISAHGDADENLPFYRSGVFLMMCVVLLVIVPLSSMKDIRFLGYSSAFGMACMLLFTMTVVIKKFSIPCPLDQNNHHDNHTVYNSSDSELEPQVCKAELGKMNSKSAYAVPTMIFSFMCHASMLPIYHELRRPTPRKMKKVAGISIFLVLVLYMISASFGYFTFYNYVQSELLLTYSKFEPKDPLIILSRVMVLTCVTLSVPLLHYPCRKTIITTFMRNPQQFNWLRHILVMVACLTLTVVMVVFIPDIRDIFGIAGATSSASLLILFPCAFYLKLTKRQPKYKRVTAMVLFVLGAIFMIFSVVMIVVDWINH
ncbi:putative sodium-coupled neutral amino acid transporter 6 [Styela clava]